MTSTSTSPSTDITQLFLKDPELLLDTELDEIVATLQAKRKEWYAEENEAKTQERRARPSKGTKSPSDLNVSLDDLDI